MYPFTCKHIFSAKNYKKLCLTTAQGGGLLFALLISHWPTQMPPCTCVVGIAGGEQSRWDAALTYCTNKHLLLYIYFGYKTLRNIQALEKKKPRGTNHLSKLGQFPIVNSTSGPSLYPGIAIHALSTKTFQSHKNFNQS